ncbi:MAG: hypothetical protein RH917_02050 [Lacipirellulaceae bacterium]
MRCFCEKFFLCFTVIPLCLGITLGLIVEESHAQTSEMKSGFAQVLIDAEVDLEAFSSLRSGSTTLTTSQRENLDQILYWMDRFDKKERNKYLIPARELAGRNSADVVGELVSLRGTARSFEKSSGEGSEGSLYSIQLEPEGVQEKVTILTRQVPRYWIEGPLSETVSCEGVVLTIPSDGSSTGHIVLAERIAWHPEKDVPAGWIELARLGYDVALLDEVRHGQPFVDERVSQEATAFREIIKAVSDANPSLILKSASREVTARRATWSEESNRLDAEWKQASSQNRSDAKTLKRKRDIALAAIDRAEKGFSSVAPLFLQPEKETGRLVLLEGTARRAVRVANEENPSVGDYFELEFFPTDSQNLPIVCCVPKLPSGFPTGDRIREPIRVGGFFFKKWRYQSRKLGSEPNQAGSQQKAAFAPLVIAPTVIWIQEPTVAGSSDFGFTAGMVGLIVIIALGILIVRAMKHDRIARRRPSRYDEGS